MLDDRVHVLCVCCTLQTRVSSQEGSGCLDIALHKSFATDFIKYVQSVSLTLFLPRCMECRRGLAMRFLSVRLSVKRVYCDKTEEKSVQIFIPCERSFSSVL